MATHSFVSCTVEDSLIGEVAGKALRVKIFRSNDLQSVPVRLLDPSWRRIPWLAQFDANKVEQSNLLFHLLSSLLPVVSPEPPTLCAESTVCESSVDVAAIR